MSSDKTFHRFEVLRTEQRSPHFVRVVLGGAAFDDFVVNDFTDRYVKVSFGAEPGAGPIRTFTLRSYDAKWREIALEFVMHERSGVAGSWVRSAQPGDPLWVRTPGGAFRPDRSADAFLFVGDETAIPAISASLAAVPGGSRGACFIEVHGPEDEVIRASPLPIHWLHRGVAEPGTTNLLHEAVTEWAWPSGRVQAFVHGESALLKSVRPYVKERVDRRDLSVSAYWRRGETEEGFRAWKAAQDEPVVIRPESA